MKKTCATCQWFVEEDSNGDYSHEKAKANGCGFCVMEDLFTDVDASFQACRDYTEESIKE